MQEDYNVSSLPMTVVVSTDGQIEDVHTSESCWHHNLNGHDKSINNEA